MRNDRRYNARRDSGGKRSEDGFGLRNAIFAAGIILALGLVAFFVTVIIYNNNLEKLYSDLEKTEIGEQNPNDSVYNSIEEASSQIGKSAEELENEAMTHITSTENEEIAQISTIEDITNNTQKPTQQETGSKTENKAEETNSNEPVQEIVFELPVEGELMKEFAQDKLVYSETLREWVMHTGVDIKADKTTVVKASESGKVVAIKNDPRYGITVIIEHANGYETRYANLLTAEFVTVGEEVTKGQTIGTVGNTSAFEVIDDFHLHFEILKNGEYQDPIFFINI